MRGAILIAEIVKNPTQHSLGLIRIIAERNSYGRQLQSCVAELRNVNVAFIRAPRFELFKNAEPSSLEIQDVYLNDPVQIADPLTGHQVSSFHPELSKSCPSPFHREFVNKCAERKVSRIQNEKVASAI